MIKKQVKRCLSCNKPLKGRSDKQFCDSDCKNAYHNAEHGAGEKVYKRVLKILRNNRKILKEVLGEKDTLSIELSKLIGKGFDNDYLTHTKKSIHKGYDYFYVFDYGYRKESDAVVKVVKAFQ